MTSVTEHSCLFISKTETLKGKVRRERERTSRYKITRCRKEERGAQEEEILAPITAWLSQLACLADNQRVANKDVFLSLHQHLFACTFRGITSLKFNNSRFFFPSGQREWRRNNLAALIWLSERVSSPIRACNSLQWDAGAAALCC